MGIAMRIHSGIAQVVRSRKGIVPGTIAVFLFIAPTAFSQTNLEQEVRELKEQNAALQQQLERQNESIDALARKVGELETNASKTGPVAEGKSGLNLNSVHLGLEGGLAFFNTGSSGFAPESEFRVDEARLFIEAPVWKEVYFYSEVDLATREEDSLALGLNELYLDFQDVSQWWHEDGQLNLRAGRLNIPFGEEYMKRNAIDNPLISHSVSDLWGVDPGIEIYGRLGKISYVVAVQNGNISGTRDFSGDKSVAGRVGYDPASWLHLSASAMRTGYESAPGDFLSAIWFGNTFFQAISTNATKFHATLVEGDATVRWATGRVSAFGGYGRYGDNNPAADDRRNIFYYGAEAVQELPWKKFYAAARFSEVLVANGLPLRGLGDAEYFSGDLTTALWRLSLGLDYRFSSQLVLKTEYSFERGNEADGGRRNREDFLGAEAAFSF